MLYSRVNPGGVSGGLSSKEGTPEPAALTMATSGALP